MTIRFLAFSLAFAFSFMCPHVWAQENVKGISDAVEQFLISETRNFPGTVNIAVGKIATNSGIEKCKRWQGFLPTGARIWGRVSVGVRCVEGTNLSLFVSATVKVHGKYIVMSRAVSAGQMLSATDVQLVEGELTALPADVVTQPTAVAGQTARQALSLNQPLRSIYLKSEAAVQAGQTVKIISRGEGFAVTNEGKALNTVERGQLVRVRLLNNQIVSGIARESGVVEISTQ